MRFEENDERVIEEVKRRNAYDLIVGGTPRCRRNYVGVHEADDDNIFLYFSGWSNPKDNGWVWTQFGPEDGPEVRQAYREHLVKNFLNIDRAVVVKKDDAD